MGANSEKILKLDNLSTQAPKAMTPLNMCPSQIKPLSASRASTIMRSINAEKSRIEKKCDKLSFVLVMCFNVVKQLSTESFSL